MRKPRKHQLLSMDVHGVSLSTPAVWTCTTDYLFHHHQHQHTLSQPGMDVQGVFLSTNSNMFVQEVSLYTANLIDVQGVTISPARSMHHTTPRLSTASGMDVLVVSLSIASSMDVQGASIF
jgi:hypothetical protein